MEDVVPDGNRRRDSVTLVGITGVMLPMTVLVYAPAEIPVADDWTYAWSVEHFLHTGELRMLEWIAHYSLARILWGALFSRLLGLLHCPAPVDPGIGMGRAPRLVPDTA